MMAIYKSLLSNVADSKKFSSRMMAKKGRREGERGKRERERERTMRERERERDRQTVTDSDRQ